MKYENPQIPEGINSSSTNPLKELLLLTSGALLALAIIAFVVGQASGWLAQFIPFETEQAISASFNRVGRADPPLQQYLDGLAERVQHSMDLPGGMDIQLHYSSGDTVNAFASLGGHVVLFRGLLEKLPHENALVMLMAHEIAHVRHRDPIRALGQGIAIHTLLGLLLGYVDAAILGETGLLTQLHFTREMESEADMAAQKALFSIYGHTAGAGDLFELLHNEHAANGGAELPAFMSSHPLDQQRIDALVRQAEAQGWVQQGGVKALPAMFSDWLDASGKK